jgi:hypothetical protein
MSLSTLRFVRSVELLRGGRNVRIGTFGPLGLSLEKEFPLNHISCQRFRKTSIAGTLPLKIKGKWYKYIIDKKGTFHDPQLFDYTVGMKRSLD